MLKKWVDEQTNMKLISACLLGVKCRWDGGDCQNGKAMDLAQKEILLPICPEQLGGLSTPRSRQEIRGGSGKDVLDKKAKVMNQDGEDVTEQFLKGAAETLKIAQMFGVKEFIGKSLSPSCSCSKIYDGTFSGMIRDGRGITAELLAGNGINIRDEESL